MTCDIMRLQTLLITSYCFCISRIAVYVPPLQISNLTAEKFKPKEQVTLEPYERDHAVVIAVYRPPKKTKKV